MKQKNRHITITKDLVKKEKTSEEILKLRRLKNAAPKIFKLLDYNYQAMCGIALIAEDEKLVRKMLKGCMKKTFKILRRYQS